MNEPAATYFAEFLSSAEILIDRLAGDLEALTHDAAPRGEVLQALLRDFHSLKGNSSFVPDCPLTPLADAAEGAVAAAHDGRIAPGSLLAPLEETIACLRTMVSELMGAGPGRPVEARGVEVEARLRALAEADGGARPVRYVYAGEEVTDLLEALIQCTDSQATGGGSSVSGERVGAAVARLHKLAAAQGASGELWAAAASGPDALLRWLAPLVRREPSAAAPPAAEWEETPSGTSESYDQVAEADAGTGTGSDLWTDTRTGTGSDLPTDADVGADNDMDSDRDKGAGGLSGASTDPDEHHAPETDAAPESMADTTIAATAPRGKVEPARTPAAPARTSLPGLRPSNPSPAAYLVPRRFQVDADAVDGFLDYVGELRVVADRLAHLNKGIRVQHMPFEAEPERRRAWERFSSDFRALRVEFDTLAARLQKSLLDIRQVPVKPLLIRHADLIHALGPQLGKEVEVVVEGGETSVDKSVIEQLESPLTHVVRNAVDHGVEAPSARVAAGKPERGTITLRAAKQGEYFKLEVVDDGCGIDVEALRRNAVERGLLSQADVTTMHASELLFRSGVTSRTMVTEVSGRGVGLDVVKTAVRQLGGTVDVASTPGRGTRLTIKVRSTGLSSVPCVPVRIGEYHFFIPHDATLAWFADDMQDDPGASDVKMLDLVRFLPDLPAGSGGEIDGLQRDGGGGGSLIVVLTGGGETYHLRVDDAGQRIDVVAQPLDQKLMRAPLWSMATVGGDHSIRLILDVDGLASSSRVDASPVMDEVSPPVFTDWTESRAAAALVVETGNKRFAVDATLVDEILTSRPVTPVPGVEAPVRGLVRSRSRLVPVLDCRRLLDGEPSRGGGVIVVLKVPEGSARRWIALEAERVTGARSREESGDGGREVPPLLDLRWFLDVEGR